jgi:hypothetical protein
MQNLSDSGTRFSCSTNDQRQATPQAKLYSAFLSLQGKVEEWLRQRNLTTWNSGGYTTRDEAVCVL